MKFTSLNIDSVIFDIGNVLLTFDYTVAEKEILKHTGKHFPPSQEHLHPLRIDHETGLISRADFVRAVRFAFEHDGPEDHFLDVWSRIFEVNTPMVEWARSLHVGTPLFLLSNIGCIHHDHIFAEYDFFTRLFRDGVYSYRVGVMKPSRRIFEIACSQFDIIPSRTLYIDDLAENVKGAKDFGLIAHHYNPKRHDFFLQEVSELSFR